MAAADLDGDGRVEVVVTTTNTSSTGSQVFVFDASGQLYRPSGAPATAWPRFNRLTGKGNDADFNGAGNHGYGAYGENVGIGNLDDDPQLEIVVTFDNHQINVFNHDGTSVLASPWFTNRQSGYVGRRLGWGQFIRWLSPAVEERHYHLHVGPWPDVRTTMWLQWTASPPSIADLDGDGRNEVIGLPNAEHEGAVRDAGVRVHGARRRAGRRRALGAAARGVRDAAARPASRPCAPDGDWYPPSGIPAPTVVDIAGDRRPEIVAVGARRVRLRGRARPASGCGATTTRTARRRRSRRRSWPPTSTATERPSSSSAPTRSPPAPAGSSCSRPPASCSTTSACRISGVDGNGIGVPAAPSIGDLDGDGRLEIVLTTFDHGIDVFRVPGSGTNCLPWPTGRGNLLRNGTGSATTR